MNYVIPFFLAAMIALFATSNLEAAFQSNTALNQALSDARFNLSYLKNELQAYPASNCLVKDSRFNVYKLSDYYRSGPLAQSGQTLAQFEGKAANIGQEVKYISIAVSMTDDAFAFRRDLIHRIVACVAQMDALANKAQAVSQSRSDNEAANENNVTEAEPTLLLIGHAPPTHEATSTSNNVPSEMGESSILQAAQVHNALQAMLGVPEQPRPTKTVNSEICQDLIDTGDAFHMLYQKSLLAEEQGPAARHAFVSELRAFASLHVSCAMLRFYGYKEKVKSMEEGNDKELAKYYLRHYANAGSYCWALERMPQTDSGFERGQHLLRQIINETMAAHNPSPEMGQLSLNLSRVD